MWSFRPSTMPESMGGVWHSFHSRWGLSAVSRAPESLEFSKFLQSDGRKLWKVVSGMTRLRPALGRT